MLTVGKKSAGDMLDELGSELGFLSGVCHFDGDPLELDGYQLAFLRNPSKYRWVVKARQVGFSFLFACEALARCHLRDGHTSVFVSYNLEDAKEKVNYARQLLEELPLAYRKRLVVDSKTELGFEPGGSSKRLSRIVSMPSKAPRGKKGDLYLDELAHYVNDREVYKGSTALILRSRGQLTGCSSPLGRRGVFWEIAEQELRPYRAYSRQRVPWWLCRFFCSDVKRAARLASGMSTEERVRRFGTPGIQDQFDSLMLDDFRQEFELDFCDESYSFYPYELILPCTTDELATYGDFHQFPSPIRGRLTAGFDVGRKRDLSELVIVEELDDVFYLRLWRSYDRVPSSEQEADLDRMLKALPIARLSIDQGGLGMHLAENLFLRHGPVIRPEDFTNLSKEVWCNDFKILLQRRAVVLPKERELVGQIHSIKKTLTPSGKASFEAERAAGESKGHADRFWALVLACQKERFAAADKAGELDVEVRVIG
jgi:phage FluMu gp28-like protein